LTFQELELAISNVDAFEYTVSDICETNKFASPSFPATTFHRDGQVIYAICNPVILEEL
jgi:hypothetical protein